jgi:hypothetical protein
MAISNREDSSNAEDLINTPKLPGHRERWSALTFTVARLSAGLLILLTLALFIFYLPRFHLLYWDMNLVRLAVAISPAVPRQVSMYYLLFLKYLSAGVSIVVGLLVYVKRVLPRNSRDWTGLVASLALVMGFLASLQPEAPLPYPFIFTLEKLIYGVYEVLSTLSFYFLVMFVFIFPNGRFSPRWMRWVAIIFSGAFVVVLINTDIDFIWFLLLFGLPLLLPPIFAFSGQVYRYIKVSTPEQRQQTKWVLYSLTVILSSFPIVFLLAPLLLPPDLQTLLEFHLVFLVAMIIPLSIGISIFRYRLFDIDIIIRRTLTYSTLSLLLALVYFGSIFSLQRIFSAISNQQSPITIVLSTLAIAALFTPLRRRIQDFIDRRFFRAKYDAEQTLSQFAATARDEVDLEQLSDALLGVVEDTMQPESLSLWLKE